MARVHDSSVRPGEDSACQRFQARAQLLWRLCTPRPSRENGVTHYDLTEPLLLHQLKADAPRGMSREMDDLQIIGSKVDLVAMRKQQLRLQSIAIRIGGRNPHRYGKGFANLLQSPDVIPVPMREQDTGYPYRS